MFEVVYAQIGVNNGGQPPVYVSDPDVGSSRWGGGWTCVHLMYNT